MLGLGGFDTQYARDEVIRMMSSRPAPTALLGGGVGSTAGVLASLRQLGIAPGEQISMVALDEWPMFDIFLPDLASVSRDSGHIGIAAAQLLLDVLGGAGPCTVSVATKYTARASVTTRVLE